MRVLNTGEIFIFKNRHFRQQVAVFRQQSCAKCTEYRAKRRHSVPT